MKKIIEIFVLLSFFIVVTACEKPVEGIASASTSVVDDDVVDNKVSSPDKLNWKTKFPSLWGTAYAEEVSPPDPKTITYNQFLDAVAEKIKSDTTFKQTVKGDSGTNATYGDWKKWVRLIVWHENDGYTHKTEQKKVLETGYTDLSLAHIFYSFVRGRGRRAP